MRLFNLIVFTLLFSTLFGQGGTAYFIKDIGWTIRLPRDFKLDDSSTILKETKEGIIILENESHLKLNMASTKNLISASRDMLNQLNVTLSKSSAPNEHFWDSVNNNVLKIFYNAMVKQASAQAKFDSSRTIEIIDGLTFKSFRTDIRVDDRLIVHNFILAKFYKGSTLFISYNYADELVGEEIKKMLRESKFAK